MRAKLREIKETLRRRMHQPIPAQGKWLGRVVRGYFNYHAVPTNFRTLVEFRSEIARRWRRALSRRSGRGKLNWEQMNRLIDDWLPKPLILHPWPDKRFAVSYPR
jgi:RNA-directed DNA polymerase